MNSERYIFLHFLLCSILNKGLDIYLERGRINLGPQLQGHRSARQIAQAGVGRIIFFTVIFA